MACGSSCGGGCGGGFEVPAGLVTELVVADEGEARAIAEEPAPCRRWPGVDAQGLDQVKLAMLWALLAGQPFCDELLQSFAPLDEASADGPWVYRVPAALVTLLADLEPERATRVATAWAGAEELELDGWEPADVRSMVDVLRGVARSARAARRPLLLWMSL